MNQLERDKFVNKLATYIAVDAQTCFYVRRMDATSTTNPKGIYEVRDHYIQHLRKVISTSLDDHLGLSK